MACVKSIPKLHKIARSRVCKFHKAGFGIKMNRALFAFCLGIIKRETRSLLLPRCFSFALRLFDFVFAYFAMQASSAAMIAALSIFLPMKTILLILSP